MAKNKALTAAEALSALLASIVVATLATGSVQVNAAEVQPLIESGHVEINTAAAPDTEGLVPGRATQLAIDEHNKALADGQDAEAGSATTAADTGSGFKILKGLQIPKATRATGERYPFSTMEAGDAFFVPNTEKKPNAAKSLLSTVSTANGRFKTDEKDADGKPVYSRRFQVSAVTAEESPEQKAGALVFRVK